MLISYAICTKPKSMDDAKGLAIAFEEAKISYDEGGIPVRSPSSSYDII